MSALLSPLPIMQFFTAAGVPLSGGKLYTYAAGTSTAQATYTDSTGNTANTNPVILNSRGEANVWISTSQYKYVLKDSTDVLIWTVDNISTGTEIPRMAAYKWTQWSPSDNIGTNTLASSTASATIAATSYVTMANSGGTVTFTFVKAGNYLVTASSFMSPQAANTTYTKLSFSQGGTATILNPSAGTVADERFLVSNNARQALSTTLAITAAVSQTVTLVPTAAVISGSSASNFLADALVTVTYVGT
jgi:hypothetical protein